MLSAALRYWDAGFCPLPINPGNKRPHFRLLPESKWESFKTERPKREEIIRWFQEAPDANLALLGGWGGLAFVDIDDPGLAEKADNVPTLQSATPNGGRHLWFRERRPSENSPVKAGVLDIKAAGGYVLVPPSVIPNELGERRPYRFLNKHPILEVENARSWGEEFGRAWGLQGESLSSSGYQALKEGVVSEGARNVSAFSFAAHLRDKGFDEQFIYASLKGINNDGRFSPPLHERELRSIARSAARYQPSEQETKGGRAEQSEPILTRLSDVEREEVRWLWTNRIALGKLCVIQGDPGTYKSWLSLALATAVTLGNPLPGDDAKRDPAKVLLLTAEDGLADTVRPRLEDMGADLTKVEAFSAVRDSQGNERQPSLVDDLAKIEIILASGGYALVVIDPISAYLGAKLDTYRDAAVRSVLAPLARLAERYGVAIVCILHLTKSQRDRAIYRGQASIAFVGAARTVHLVGANPGDERERVIACLKNNLAPMPPALTFAVTNGQFLWGKETGVTPQALLQPDASEDERAELDEAKEFLLEQLSGEPVEADETKKKARSVGLSERTLRRAKKVLGVVSVREGFGQDGRWVWSLPKGANTRPSKGLATYEVSTNPRETPSIHDQPTLQRSLATYGSGTPERTPPYSNTTKAPCEDTNWCLDETMESRFVCGVCRAVWDYPSR
ncbi:MAG: hypothetical protein G01um101438_463 [Parcubacteria group bacterium Gr01-1014_38]|nr:MAG: hypothetical protein G01um101438_463 [Parcubacteria group bacterium Gr01-1014_38]